MADETHPSSAGARSGRRDIIVSCWLCGIRTSSRQMVPDGGSACADIRWYCKDARACTGRWTMPRAPQPKGAASAGAAANRARRNAGADAVGAAASEGTRPDAAERTGTREQAASPARHPSPA